ncbi:MAG: ketoacyl-ACP synthase III [Saprospirales bacterium]|nr:MAG: ketoacyl-ACP synthase III [Saprospirales bacterium]
MKRAAIKGVMGYLPEDKLTNTDLEKLVDTTDEWIKTRTGISERRILKKEGWASSDMGAEAVKGLLKKTNTSPDEIDLLICATVTADMVFPDNANTICNKSGINNAFGFDINAACSGFLYSLTTGAKFIESGMCNKVIVVGTDMMSSIIDYTDRTTCVLFGDGAGAILLEASTDDTGIINSQFGGDGAGSAFLHMKAGGSKKPATVETVMNREHFVYQEGRSVFKYAVKGMANSINTVMKRSGLNAEDINWVVPHQANLRIINSVASSAGVPLEQVMINIHKYGNTTSGTLPLCLWDYESQLKKGDNLILTAFGGGFTWGATHIKWSYDGSDFSS